MQKGFMKKFWKTFLGLYTAATMAGCSSADWGYKPKIIVVEPSSKEYYQTAIPFEFWAKGTPLHKACTWKFCGKEGYVEKYDDLHVKTTVECPYPEDAFDIHCYKIDCYYYKEDDITGHYAYKTDCIAINRPQ